MMGESGEKLDRSVDVDLSPGTSERLAREALERPLRPERTEAASALLSFDESPFAKLEDERGLSVLIFPGILDRSERNDRDDSLVSDLLKDGYDWRVSPLEAPVPLDEPSLEAWLPITDDRRNLACPRCASAFTRDRD